MEEIEKKFLTREEARSEQIRMREIEDRLDIMFRYSTVVPNKRNTCWQSLVDWIKKK